MKLTEQEYADLMARRGTLIEPKKRRSKYGNKKKIINGVEFDSVKEAARYVDLLEWQASGQITELVHQEVIRCEVNNVHVCDYVADFTYQRQGERVIEDVKSVITRKNRAYRIKKKLVEAIYNITITEV